MANNTYKTSLTMQDKLTPTMRTVIKSINLGIKAFDALDSASGRAMSSAAKNIDDLEREVSELAGDISGKLPKATNEALKATEDLSRGFDKMPPKVQAVNDKVQQTSILLMGVNSAIAIASKAINALKGFTEMADNVALTKARLDLMNDGLQTTEQLQQKIFKSAERSRGSYEDTAQAVAKMGLLAKDAFSSNDEVVAFMEQVNKQFTISGTETQGQKAALLQLTQAMGMGVLRGQELNSIFEQTPTMIEAIANYLDVPIGQIREMAGEGLITSDVVKNAMLAMADETNAKFESMPLTFGQAMTNMQNQVMMSFQPVFEMFNQMVGSEGFQAVMESIINVMGHLAYATQIVGAAFGMLASGIAWVFSLFSPLLPLLEAVGAAMMIVVGAIAIYTAVVKMATIAQQIWNAVLAMNPIIFVIMAIIALVLWVVKLWQTNLDFKYGFLAIWNSILAFMDGVVLGFVAVGYGIADAFSYAKVMVANILEAMVNNAINMINNLISVVNKIPGVSIDAIDNVTFGATVAVEEEAKRQGRSDALASKRAENEAKKAQRETDLAAKRAAEEAEIAAAEAMANGDLNVGPAGGAASGAMELKGGKLDSVGKIDDDVTISDEDIKLLKDIAATEYINKFTTLTPSVNVSFGDVHENADVSALPGVIENMIVDALATNLNG